MLESLWNLFAGIFVSIWGLLSTVTSFVCDALLWLHVDAPRLEGLLVGIFLAWLLVRRDSHPLLRVASAPLKLILDILDLAWGQVEEVADDLWSTAKSWTAGSVGWVKSKIAGLYDSLMKKLNRTKENLEQED